MIHRGKRHQPSPLTEKAVNLLAEAKLRLPAYKSLRFLFAWLKRLNVLLMHGLHLAERMFAACIPPPLYYALDKSISKISEM